MSKHKDIAVAMSHRQELLTLGIKVEVFVDGPHLGKALVDPRDLLEQFNEKEYERGYQDGYSYGQAKGLAGRT